MKERKYKVTWEQTIIAKDMQLNDALPVIKALCKKYPNNRINITLLDNKKHQRRQYKCKMI